MMRSEIRYTVLGLIAITLWGSILPLLKLATDQQGAAATLLGVQGIAGLCSLAWWLLRGEFPKSLAPYRFPAFALRLVLFVAHVCATYLAVSMITRPELPAVIFCHYLWPTLVLLYSLIFTQLKITHIRLFVAGVALAVFALLLEVALGGLHGLSDSSAVMAIIVAFFAANSWGLYSAITRRYGEQSGGSAVVPLFHLCAAFVGLLVLLISGSFHVGELSLITLWPILAAGAINFVAYLCWDIAMRRGEVVTLSLLADFIPWISLGTASVLLGITINERTLVSAAILVAGAIMTRLATPNTALSGNFFRNRSRK